MNIIILAISNSIIWTLLTIRWKILRQNDISAISSFGLLCAGLPFWAISFGYLIYQNSFIFSGKYFLNISAWIILCIATNLGALFILKFKALSELGMYKLAISTLVAMIIDMVFLQNKLSVPILIGVILLLFSGFLLPKNKSIKKDDIKFSSTILLLLFLSVAGAVQYATYKNALMIQTNPLLHSMFAEGILYFIFLIICFNGLKKDFKAKKIKISDFIFFGTLIYIFTIIETFLFKQLPITILVSLTVLNILLYQIYDVKNKDLKHSWQLYLATFISIGAIIIIKLN